METVNNITAAASRAIWGEETKSNETQGQEPVSGQVGDTASGEPYDKGNTEPTTSTSTTETPSTSTGLESSTSDLKPSITTPETSTLPIRPEQTTSKTGATDLPTPSTAATSDPPTSTNPSTTTPDSSTPSQKQQGADRPHEEPNSGESDRIKETKREAEEAAAIDTSGPGPVPLEQKAKGVSGSAGEDDDGPQKESHGEGTGEKYVKSSGMKADGGDFDASNPGAGKEADRLLETKGVQREAPAKGSSDVAMESSSTSDPKEGKTKLSLKDKIKEKLHKH